MRPWSKLRCTLPRQRDLSTPRRPGCGLRCRGVAASLAGVFEVEHVTPVEANAVEVMLRRFGYGRLADRHRRRRDGGSAHLVRLEDAPLYRDALKAAGMVGLADTLTALADLVAAWG